MRWIEALKIWNKEHNPGKWCVARKGSPEYDQVKAIMAGGAHKKEEAKKAEAAELKAAEAPKKFVVRKVAKKTDEAAKAFGGTKKEDVMRDMVHLPALEAKARMKKRETVKAFLKKALEERRAKKAAASEPKAPVKRELGFPKKEYDYMESAEKAIKYYNDTDNWKAASSKQRAELYSTLNDPRIDFSKVADHIKRGMRLWCKKENRECEMDKLGTKAKEKAKASEPKAPVAKEEKPLAFPIPYTSELARYDQFKLSGKFRKERLAFEEKYKHFLADRAAKASHVSEEGKSEAYRMLASEKKQLADAEAELQRAEGHHRAVLEVAIPALKKSIAKREAALRKGTRS